MCKYIFMKKVSLLIPFYNEQEVLPLLFEKTPRTYGWQRRI